MSAATENGQPTAEAAELLRYRHILAAAGIGTWEMDLTTNRVVWDEQCRALFGLPTHDSISYAEALQYIHPDDRARVDAAVKAALAGDNDGRCDETYRALGADGVLRHVRFTGQAEFDAAGNAARFSGVAQDTTTSATVQQKSDAIERIAQTALESTGAGWYRLEIPSGAFEHSAEVARIMTGDRNRKFSREELATYIHPDDRAIRQEAYAVAEKTDHLDYTVRFCWADGSVHWVRVTGRYHRDAAGRVNLFTGTVQDITAQKAAEREAMLKDRAVAASADGICITGGDLPDSPIVYVNEAFERMTGYMSEEILGKDCRFLQGEDHDQPDLPRLRECLNSGQPCTVVLRNYKKDGTLFYNELSVAPVVENGKLVHFVGIQKDVTARLQTEEALRQSEQRFRSVFNGQFLFLAILAPDGRVLDINELPLKAVGSTREEILGKIFWETPWWRGLPEMRAGWPGRLEQAAKTDGPVISEDHFQTDTGEVRIADAAVTAVKDASGRVEFFIVQASDVTERKVAEAALRASEERYQSFVRQSSEGIWRFEIPTPVHTDLTVEEQLDIIFEHAYLAECNDAMARMYGFEKAEQLYGRHIQDFMPRDEEGEAYIRAFIESGYRLSGAVSKEVHRDGHDVYILNNLIGIIEDGAVRRAWGTQRDITAEKEAQRALEESEFRLRELTETLPAILWVTEPDGSCTYLNKRWYDYTGQSHDEALGFGWLDATHPDDKERTGKLFVEANSERKRFIAPYRLRTKDGTYRWAVDSGQPRFAPDGTYRGMIGTVVDMHEQHEAEEAVRQSEQKFRSVIQAAPAAMGLFIGRDLIIESPNQTFIDIVGKGWDVVGKPLREAMPELVTEGQPFLKILDDVFTTGVPFVSPASMVKIVREGVMTDNYYNITYTPLFNEAGDVYAILDIAIDVTEQVKAQQALEESETQFRSLIEEAPVATCLFVDRELRIEVANNAMIAMIGKGPDIIGKPLLEVVPEIADQSFAQILTTVFDTGETFEAKAQPATLIMHGEEQHFYFDYIFKPLRNAAGEVWAIIDMTVDVTAAVEARRELEESELFNRSIFEYSPVAKAVYTAPDFSIHAVNERMLDLMGRSQDIIGKKYFDVLPELRGTPVEERLRRVMATGETFHTDEERVEHLRHGVPYEGYYSFTFKPLRNAAGEVYGVMDTAVEVTANVLARKELEEQKAYLQNALDIGNLGTFRVDYRSGIGHFTENIREWFGLGALDVPMAEVQSRLHPDDYQLVKDVVDVAATNPARHKHDITYRTIDVAGATHYLRSIGAVTLDKHGAPESLNGIIQNVTAEVEAQQRIEEGQRQILESFEQSPVAIALIDEEDLTFRMVNPFYAQLVGREPEELVDKPLLQAIPELRGQGYDELLRRVITTGTAYIDNEASVQLERGQGLETRYVDLHYQPRRATDGRVTGVLVIATDVTAGVMARRVVEESEQKLRSLVEGAPFPIGLYVGREMRIQLANRSIIKTWGKGDDVVGKTYFEILPELEGTGIYDQLISVYETGKPYHAKNQRVDLVVNGELRPHFFNYSFTPVLDADGKVYGVMNTAANVTDIALARQRAEDAEASLRGAIELAELATWEVDATAGTGDCSERLRVWIGMREDEEPLAAFMEAVHPEDRSRVAEGLQRALELQANGYYDEEYRLINRFSSRQRIIHAHGRTITDAAGKAIRISGTAQDVTKERALQAELERQVAERTTELADAARNLQRSNEELSQYAYVASHDLQEPLRKIQMFSGILNKQGDLPETARGTLSRITGAAERMSTLIQSLLEFSRLQKSNDALMRPVNLGDVVRDVVHDFELLISERGATVDVGELPVVEGVGLQMNQLFYNLVGNALKFAKPGVAPEVHIASRTIPAAEADGRLDGRPTATHYHHITIADTGIGFEVRYAEQIFEVFKRLHGRDAYPGSGIGLALCRRIVANHSGALWAESEVGKGSTFNILLPQTEV